MYRVLIFFVLSYSARTYIYTLSLHDALPIYSFQFTTMARGAGGPQWSPDGKMISFVNGADRKSTRLNSSHTVISYAVFCLKKKKHSLRSSKSPGHTPPQH